MTCFLQKLSIDQIQETFLNKSIYKNEPHSIILRTQQIVVVLDRPFVQYTVNVIDAVILIMKLFAYNC